MRNTDDSSLQTSSGPASDEFAKKVVQDVLEWAWPRVVAPMHIFDKNSRRSVRLSVDELTWKYPCAGRECSITFQPSPLGLLQRKLCVLTQRANGPKSLQRFSTSLISEWSLYRDLLLQGAAGLRDVWDAKVLDKTCAGVAKCLLLKAAELQVGPWRPENSLVIKSLDARTSIETAAQLKRLRERAHSLPIATQSAIVQVLDEAAREEDWDDKDLEGLCALASMYQHGVRPVQIIVLNVPDVLIFSDSDGHPGAVLTFHTAKRGVTQKVEPLPRAVRSEWVRLFERLRQRAIESGRLAFMSATKEAQLEALAKMSCRIRGYRLEFQAGQLRHTAIQTLADAGHSRKSLQQFAGHKRGVTASIYHGNTLRSGELVNRAIGASKLYGDLIDMGEVRWVTVEQMRAAPEDEQIGVVLGDRLVAGIGLCKRKQRLCTFDPGPSCYGCSKHLPSDDLDAHVEAAEAMRALVQELAEDANADGQGLGQMERPLARVQQHIALLRERREGP